MAQVESQSAEIKQQLATLQDLVLMPEKVDEQ